MFEEKLKALEHMLMTSENRVIDVDLTALCSNKTSILQKTLELAACATA